MLDKEMDNEVRHLAIPFPTATAVADPQVALTSFSPIPRSIAVKVALTSSEWSYRGEIDSAEAVKRPNTRLTLRWEGRPGHSHPRQDLPGGVGGQSVERGGAVLHL